MEFEPNKPNYRCTFAFNGKEETLDLDESGDLLYNDNPVETLEDHKNVLRLLLKGLVHSVGGGSR